MYELNQVLVYGNNGVCRLVDIRKEKFTGSPAMYYILAPLYSGQSTLYVPAENPKLSSKLRPVMLKEKLHEIMQSVRDSDVQWEKDDRLRGEKFHDIAANGSTGDMLKVMKSLVKHRSELKNSVKKFHNADERMLSLCEKVVGEEYAYAYGVDVESALTQIESFFDA